MSVAQDESDLIERRRALSGELYAYLDALWNAAVQGELPSQEDLLGAEDVLERVDGRE